MRVSAILFWIYYEMGLDYVSASGCASVNSESLHNDYY